MKTQLLDTSYCSTTAERRLGVAAGSMPLDELARRMSMLPCNSDDPISVRYIDTTKRKTVITHSRVYFRGEATGATPHLLRGRS